MFQATTTLHNIRKSLTKNGRVFRSASAFLKHVHKFELEYNVLAVNDDSVMVRFISQSREKIEEFLVSIKYWLNSYSITKYTPPLYEEMEFELSRKSDISHDGEHIKGPLLEIAKECGVTLALIDSVGVFDPQEFDADTVDVSLLVYYENVNSLQNFLLKTQKHNMSKIDIDELIADIQGELESDKAEMEFKQEPEPSPVASIDKGEGRQETMSSALAAPYGKGSMVSAISELWDSIVNPPQEITESLATKLKAMDAKVIVVGNDLDDRNLRVFSKISADYFAYEVEVALDPIHEVSADVESGKYTLMGKLALSAINYGVEAEVIRMAGWIDTKTNLPVYVLRISPERQPGWQERQAGWQERMEIFVDHLKDWLPEDGSKTTLGRAPSPATVKVAMPKKPVANDVMIPAIDFQQALSPNDFVELAKFAKQERVIVTTSPVDNDGELEFDEETNKQVFWVRVVAHDDITPGQEWAEGGRRIQAFRERLTELTNNSSEGKLMQDHQQQKPERVLKYNNPNKRYGLPKGLKPKHLQPMTVVEVLWGEGTKKRPYQTTTEIIHSIDLQKAPNKRHECLDVFLVQFNTDQMETGQVSSIKPTQILRIIAVAEETTTAIADALLKLRMRTQEWPIPSNADLSI